MGLAGQCYYGCCGTRMGHLAMEVASASLRRIGVFKEFHLPVDALGLNHSAVKGLMKLWSRIHWSPGDGMMPADQLLAVYKLAVEWPVDGATVELGAWVGLTTSYLGAACRVRGRGRVYAVDTFEGTREGNSSYPSIGRYGGNTYGAFCDQIRRAGVQDLVEPLVGFTDTIGLTYEREPIRFLLIDADHSYEGVKRDFERWSPHVASGGLIVFHDYLMPDVARFVDESVRSNIHFADAPGEVVSNVFAVTKR